MYTHIIIHYDEIGLKKKNRSYFEDALKTNIQRKLKDLPLSIYKQYGRLVATINQKTTTEEIKKRLSFVPGISSFSFGFSTNLDVQEFSEKSISILSEQTFKTFKVETKRSNKMFKLTSIDINKKVGENILNHLNKKVDLTNPEKTIFIEVCEKNAFVYDNKHYGISGLPIRKNNSVVCSLSGGLDSPVSAYLMMKRGCEVIFAHVQNNTLTNQKLEEKICDLVKQLTKVQLKSKLYIIPFSDIQKKLIMYVPSEYRMIIYRRFMFKIIEEIVKKEKAFAVVTGDSVGQVASQTLENISVIYDACSVPIFSPLIGCNKEEIVQVAKKIGTYDISIKPYPDCCSFMVAEHPITKGSLKDIKHIEEKIPDKQKMIEEVLLKLKKKEMVYEKE